jgi:hypothetical protein
MIISIKESPEIILRAISDIPVVEFVFTTWPILGVQQPR